MHELAPLIYDLAVMLGVAAIVTLVFQRIHQPVVLGYLIAGLIIGPYTPPYSFVTDTQSIHTLSELGVIFLMFSLGLEFSFKKLMRVGLSASVAGSIEVVFMLSVGFIAGKAMGWSKFDSLFLGAALAISSTTIIIKAIDELKLKTARFAELVFGILIVEDLLAIVMLVGLSTFVMTNDVLSYDMLSAVIKLVLVVGGWFIIGYFFVPKVFRSIAGYVSEETLTITSVALCLLLVAIAAKFHYSTALGAFIMGSILAETKLVHAIHQSIMPIRDIFAAVFFISIGMLIDPHIIMQEWQAILFISFLTIVGKAFITSFGAFITGQSLPTSIRSGFSMAQIGEFSFIIVALGVSLDAVGNKIYPLIVAVSAITTFTTPYLIRLSLYVGEVADKRLPVGMRAYLQRYTNWACRAQTTQDEDHSVRNAIIRLFVNGIIVAIIFTIAGQVVYPHFSYFASMSWHADLTGLIIALIVASPFIWGMLSSPKGITMGEGVKAYLHPIVFFIWFLTLLELTILTLLDFSSWATVSVFLAIAIIFFAFLYRKLEKSYKWLESQLIENIDLSPHDQEHADKGALKDAHFVIVHVSEFSNLKECSLNEIDAENTYNVGIVAIVRDGQLISMPPTNETIHAGDDLIVFGTDKYIEIFKQQIESKPCNVMEQGYLDKFKVEYVYAGHESPLVGQKIEQLESVHKVVGMIVGIERDGTRILYPEGKTVIAADDLLLIVAEADKMS